MMKSVPITIALLLILPVICLAQTDTAKANAEVEKKAAEWTAGLKLTDTEKQKRVTAALLTHLKTIRDW
ncbi:MAG TPA: DUF3826 domain-containing protein, partial [Niastella sp.]|nr:DUF3826 domain-containing protein [Niastella sp.]